MNVEIVQDTVTVHRSRPSRTARLISVVIPLRNEVQSVGAVVKEVLEAGSKLSGDKQLEIVLVDDGSTDGTWDAIVALCERRTGVLGIRLRRNFGKGTALKLGFGKARGEYVVTMDGDLQDDAGHLPELAAMLDEGYDVVCGWKQPRRDPWHKVLPSRLLNCLVRRLFRVQIHDLNCGLKGSGAR